MLKLAQFLSVPPAVATLLLLLLAVYRFLLLSLRASVRTGISTRTRVHIFLSVTAHLALLFVAALVVLVALRTL